MKSRFLCVVAMLICQLVLTACNICGSPTPPDTVRQSSQTNTNVVTERT